MQLTVQHESTVEFQAHFICIMAEVAVFRRPQATSLPACHGWQHTHQVLRPVSNGREVQRGGFSSPVWTQPQKKTLRRTHQNHQKLFADRGSLIKLDGHRLRGSILTISADNAPQKPGQREAGGQRTGHSHCMNIAAAKQNSLVNNRRSKNHTVKRMLPG